MFILNLSWRHWLAFCPKSFRPVAKLLSVVPFLIPPKKVDAYTLLRDLQVQISLDPESLSHLREPYTLLSLPSIKGAIALPLSKPFNSPIHFGLKSAALTLNAGGGSLESVSLLEHRYYIGLQNFPLWKRFRGDFALGGISVQTPSNGHKALKGVLGCFSIHYPSIFGVQCSAWLNKSGLPDPDERTERIEKKNFFQIAFQSMMLKNSLYCTLQGTSYGLRFEDIFSKLDSVISFQLHYFPHPSIEITVPLLHVYKPREDRSALSSHTFLPLKRIQLRWSPTLSSFPKHPSQLFLRFRENQLFCGQKDPYAYSFCHPTPSEPNDEYLQVAYNRFKDWSNQNSQKLSTLAQELSATISGLKKQGAPQSDVNWKLKFREICIDRSLTTLHNYGEKRGLPKWILKHFTYANYKPKAFDHFLTKISFGKWPAADTEASQATESSNLCIDIDALTCLGSLKDNSNALEPLFKSDDAFVRLKAIYKFLQMFIPHRKTPLISPLQDGEELDRNLKGYRRTALDFALILSSEPLRPCLMEFIRTGKKPSPAEDENANIVGEYQPVVLNLLGIQSYLDLPNAMALFKRFADVIKGAADWEPPLLREGNEVSGELV